MGIELICECCGSPMCAFTHRPNGTKICRNCWNADQLGATDERVHMAIGALEAADRGYTYYQRGRYVDRVLYGESPLKAKAKALIKHDKILRGECLEARHG